MFLATLVIITPAVLVASDPSQLSTDLNPVNGKVINDWYSGEDAPHMYKGLWKVDKNGYAFLVYRNAEDKNPKVYSLSFYDEDAEIEARDIIAAEDKEVSPNSKPKTANIKIVGYPDPNGNKIDALYGFKLTEEEKNIPSKLVEIGEVTQGFKQTLGHHEDAPGYYLGTLSKHKDSDTFTFTLDWDTNPPTTISASFPNSDSLKEAKELYEKELAMTPNKDGIKVAVIGYLMNEQIQVCWVTLPETSP